MLQTHASFHAGVFLLGLLRCAESFLRNPCHGDAPKMSLNMAIHAHETCKGTSNDEAMNLDLRVCVKIDIRGRFLGNYFRLKRVSTSECMRSPCGVLAESPWSPVCPAVESGLRPGCRKASFFTHKAPATAPDSAAYTVLNLH